MVSSVSLARVARSRVPMLSAATMCSSVPVLGSLSSAPAAWVEPSVNTSLRCGVHAGHGIGCETLCRELRNHTQHSPKRAVSSARTREMNLRHDASNRSTVSDYHPTLTVDRQLAPSHHPRSPQPLPVKAPLDGCRQDVDCQSALEITHISTLPTMALAPDPYDTPTNAAAGLPQEARSRGQFSPRRPTARGRRSTGRHDTTRPDTTRLKATTTITHATTS
jgi:hypothetical protein